ncbi:MAG: calcineurin-like phosphoesterase family protein [Pseudomonadota bacterium]
MMRAPAFLSRPLCFGPLAALAPLLLAAACATPAEKTAAPAQEERVFSDYRGAPEIIRGDSTDAARGVVFEDRNRNSRRDAGEPGLAGVKVSNGRDIVLTDGDGAYVLPVRDDMAVFVIQPAGYQVPHNDDWVPQFAYQHKPAGSPKLLRYGGLPPTGPLPEAINFPLIPAAPSDAFDCVILGDIQAYANQDISYFRDSTVDDILRRGSVMQPDCIVAVGDVMGDDLGLIPRMAEVISTIKAPQWWVHGNHDFDFDADYDEDSADSWRRLHGPNYFAFEIGEVLFISLDNVVYPCAREDAKRQGRAFCVTENEKRYNGRITDDQMTFVKNLLALTDEDKLIVFTHHIPFVSFIDQNTIAHQTDNVAELYAMVEGRAALSLSGHTHSVENLNPGDGFAGWAASVGVESTPFRHIVAGAASGAWYNGDFDFYGVPMALQRMGGPRGWFDLRFDGAEYVETYHGSNLGRDRRMWVSVNTPGFRAWYETIQAWRDTPRENRDPVPPLSINDLPDVKIITPEDLAAGSYLTANIWDGTTNTEVVANVAGHSLTMQQTQPAEGEAAKIGAQWADPFAIQRQFSVARWALQSRSGKPRNQGWESGRGNRNTPQPPQPQRATADRSSHLWRARLPENLDFGVHAVTITTTDRHGRKATDTIVLEVRDRRPPTRFRTDIYEAFEDGPPVREAK